MEGKNVIIKLIKSPIGATVRQKRTIRALGLHRMFQEVTLPANPAVLGMIRKMDRWLEVK